jgi:diguanylate cyclase (GGDEF)-like protein
MTNGVASHKTREKPRPVVGVLMDSVESYFLARIIENLIEVAEDQGFHLVFFLGGSLEKGKTAGPYSFSYTLPDTEFIEALIVLPNSIAPWDPNAAIKLILAQYPDIPVYSLFGNSPDCCSFHADEKNAIEEMLSHLVDDHSYKKFAIAMGPDAPESLSRKRFNIIRHFLDRKKISIDPENIFHTEFRIEDGGAVAQKILAREANSPDILVCMNDQMAIGAVKEFIDKGISVPEDIAIVGFDDDEENSALPCSFTTISNPIWNLVNGLMERMAAHLSGKETYQPSSTTMKALFIHRESCGCTSWFEKNNLQGSSFIPLDQQHSSHGKLRRVALLRRTLEDTLEESITKKDGQIFGLFVLQVLQTLSRSGDFTNSFLDTFSTQWTLSLLHHQDSETQILINTLFVDAFRLLMQTKAKNFSRIHNNDRGTLRFYQNCNALIGQKLSLFNALKAIGANLPQMGINRCIIVFIDADDPEVGEIRLNYLEGKFMDVPEKNFKRIPIHRLTDSDIKSIFEPIAVLTIAHENTVYGYIVFSVIENHYDQFSLIQKIVSQIIDSSMTNELLSTHIQTLTQKNDILSRLSIVDEFTGLSNRRALYVTGRSMYQRALDTGETSCFIFLDMDGLKKINDTYGHKQGDVAILALANILKKCFREKDLVVRYGGDEFIVLMVNIHNDVVEKALSRITEHIESFNRKKTHDWQLSVSWGFAFSDATLPPKTFENIIEESDARLYQEKRKKKEGLL